MKFHKKLGLFWQILLVVNFIFNTFSWAGPAAPITFMLTQPNGTEFKAKTVGDEWNNWTVTEDGYTIIKNEKSGYWVYGELNSEGKLIQTSLRVGIDKPLGIKKGLRPKLTKNEGTNVEQHNNLHNTKPDQRKRCTDDQK